MLRDAPRGYEGLPLRVSVYTPTSAEAAFCGDRSSVIWDRYLPLNKRCRSLRRRPRASIRRATSSRGCLR
jgi:hypothetical protein